VPSISYPELHSYAKSNATILAEAKNSNNILELLNLPLSQQAFSQLGQLQLDINVLQVNDNNDH